MQLIKIFFTFRLLRDGAEEWGTSFSPFSPFPLFHLFTFFTFLPFYLFIFNFLPFHFFTFSFFPFCLFHFLLFHFFTFYFFPFTQSNSVRVKKFQMSSSEGFQVKDEPASRDRERNVLCRQFQRVESGISTCCVCQIDVSNLERECYKRPFASYFSDSYNFRSTKYIFYKKELKSVLYVLRNIIIFVR